MEDHRVRLIDWPLELCTVARERASSWRRCEPTRVTTRPSSSNRRGAAGTCADAGPPSSASSSCGSADHRTAPVAPQPALLQLVRRWSTAAPFRPAPAPRLPPTQPWRRLRLRRRLPPPPPPLQQLRMSTSVEVFY